MKRVNLKEEETLKPNGAYFPQTQLQLIPTGCTLLDSVLGGGWVLGRVANLIGDKSVGKTLLAIEAAANFDRSYSGAKIFYREAEAAFDVSYAEVVGLPARNVDFGEDGPDTMWDTIESIYQDLDTQLNLCVKKGVPGLYIIDSLDALRSEASLKRKVGEGSYNLEKQKVLADLLASKVRALREAKVCLFIISQVRENIGVLMYGPKYKRTGGKSLDFYASHIVWLSHLKTLTRQVNGEKRATAVQIKAKCTKNKIAPAFRECEFVIRFGYGVDEIESSLAYLSERKRLGLLGLTEAKLDSYVADVDKATTLVHEQELVRIRQAVQQAWMEIEDALKPTRRKYERNQ